jgi:hypothetical protein
MLGGKLYCSYSETREYHDIAMLPVDDVQIETIQMSDIGLGESIFTNNQLEEFANFQDSQGTRKAYLAETAELAKSGRDKNVIFGCEITNVIKK